MAGSEHGSRPWKGPRLRPRGAADVNALQSSWPYRLWVVGGLIAVVALAMIDGGPGLPVVLLPAFALVVYGALRTLNLVRELGRSEGPSEDSAEN